MKKSSVTENRNLYIGGSDVPIIMGISPFKARFELLQEKAGILENDFKGNEYTEYGDKLEAKIRDYINESLFQKNPFKEDCKIVGNLRGNVDGANHTTILEIKTTSQIKESVDEYKNYLVQLLFYMQIYKKTKGILAIYERPKDFNDEFDAKRLVTYTIDIDEYEDLIEELNEAIDRFLNDLEALKNNPFATEEDLQPKEIIEISNKLEKLENDLIVYNELKKQYEETKTNLLKAMEERNIKKFETNQGTKITVVKGSEDTTVEEFNTEKFKTENEEIYTKYLEEKIKKGRKSYLKITLGN